MVRQRRRWEPPLTPIRLHLVQQALQGVLFGCILADLLNGGQVLGQTLDSWRQEEKTNVRISGCQNKCQACLKTETARQLPGWRIKSRKRQHTSCRARVTEKPASARTGMPQASEICAQWRSRKPGLRNARIRGIWPWNSSMRPRTWQVGERARCTTGAQQDMGDKSDEDCSANKGCGRLTCMARWEIQDMAGGKCASQSTCPHLGCHISWGPIQSLG